jgi:hypothetical protein
MHHWSSISDNTKTVNGGPFLMVRCTGSMANLQRALEAYIARELDCLAHYFGLLSLATSQLGESVDQAF